MLRLSLAYFALTIILAVSLVFLFAQSWKTFTDRVQQWRHWDVATHFAVQLKQLEGPGLTEDRVQQELHKLSELNPETQTYLLSPDGTIELSLAEKGLRSSNVPITPVNRILSHEGPLSSAIYGTDPLRDRRAVFSAARMTLRGQPYIVYTVLDTEAHAVLFEMLAQSTSLRSGLGALLVAFVAMLLLGMMVFTLLTRRFHRLTDMAESFLRGNFAARVADLGNDEVGLLAETMNKLADTVEAHVSELKQNDQQRRQLISDVAHDVRRPIAHCRTRLELMQEKLQAGSLKDPQDYVDRALGSLDSLTELVNDLFELSKLETAGMHLTRCEVSLNQLLEDVCLAQQASSTELGVIVRLELPAEPIIVEADYLLLHRLAANLVENAVEYSKAGSEVLVRLQKEDGRVITSVHDSGIGISPEDVEHIFKPFFRGERAREHSGRGSGLGLPIAQKIALAHGSKISVESATGQGTIFSFALDRR